jgi:hypothetical protein
MDNKVIDLEYKLQCKHESSLMFGIQLITRCEKTKKIFFECRGCFHWERPIARSWYEDVV